MTELLFSMNGEPRGKGRPRATTRGGKPGPDGEQRKAFASVYTDSKTKAYEASIKAIAAVKMRGRERFEGPLSVSLRFRLGLPKSMPKYLRQAYLSGERIYAGGPDVDNMAKSILDGMNEVCFADDKQIVRLFVTKTAAEQPGVDVRIEAIFPQAAEA